MRLRLRIVALGMAPVLVSVLVLVLHQGGMSWAAVDALLIGLLVGVGLALLCIQELVRPMVRLRSAARRLRAAHGSEPSAKEFVTEDLGLLAGVFTSLAAEVRQALREARDNHEQMEAIFARMADGVLVVDGELRILRLNPAAADILAVMPERAVGHTVIEATMHHGLDELFRAALAAGYTQSQRLETIQPRRRLVQALVTPLESDGSGPAVVAVLQDLTEFDRVERVRRDFVTNVSHELRTPVTSIRVMAESLRRGALRQPELAEQFLQSITEASERLARLVDDVLALARVEAGPSRREWQTVLLPELIGDVVASQQALARQYGVTLEGDCPEPITIPGDAEGLRQAVTNLLSNGIKYNRPEGRVRVRLRRTPEQVLLQVSDTGIGIAAEHLPRIFERFYRVDRGRSREVGGTGLGLAIVRHVAEAHGGRVEVESTPGEGSCFTLVIPAQDPAGFPGSRVPEGS